MIVCTCGRKFTKYFFPIRCACGEVINGPSSIPSHNSHWPPLHQYAIDHTDDWDATEAKAWLNDWSSRIPGGCDCDRKWAEYCKQHPPNFSNADHFFAWGVEAHNYVSTHHVSPPLTVLSIDSARRLWKGPKVAFLATTYAKIGGTEVFHQTLVPRLRQRLHVLGFGVTGYLTGDPLSLKVPFVYGEENCLKLTKQADVVVAWGIDNLKKYIGNSRASVINCHHGNLDSGWSNDLVMAQRDIAPTIAAVNPVVASQLGGHYIANCVDPARCLPDLVDWREKLQLQTSDKIAFWCARISDEKQPSLAIRIGKSLSSGWVLVIAGDGPGLGKLKADAEGVPGLRVIGAIDTPGPLLHHASCFISTALHEGFGLSMAEAMYCQVPVVATPVGIATSSEITHRMSFDATPEEWAGQIVADDISKVFAAKQAVMEKWSVDRFIDQWESLIRKA